MRGRVLLFMAMAAAIAISGPAAADPPYDYLVVGFGAACAGPAGSCAPLHGLGVTFQIGKQFHRHWHWFDEFDAVVNDHEGIPTLENETELSLVTGARWTPFSTTPDARLQPAAVYAKAGLGLQVWPLSSPGPFVALAVGYLPLQGARWAVGAEAGTEVSLSGSWGQGWMGALVFELTN